jgi:hypothetical protein
MGKKHGGSIIEAHNKLRRIPLVLNLLMNQFIKKAKNNNNNNGNDQDREAIDRSHFHTKIIP